MRILHIAAHLGDGAGKAIGGLARLDAAAGNEVLRRERDLAVTAGEVDDEMRHRHPAGPDQ